jgi:hypothetical protein
MSVEDRNNTDQGGMEDQPWSRGTPCKDPMIPHLVLNSVVNLGEFGLTKRGEPEVLQQLRMRHTEPPSTIQWKRRANPEHASTRWSGHSSQIGSHMTERRSSRYNIKDRRNSDIARWPHDTSKVKTLLMEPLINTWSFRNRTSSGDHPRVINHGIHWLYGTKSRQATNSK